MKIRSNTSTFSLNELKIETKYSNTTSREKEEV